MEENVSGCFFLNTVYFRLQISHYCSFNNSENAPIRLLFSNLACGLALDRRASL